MQGIKKFVRTVVFVALLGIIGFTLYNLFFLKPKVYNLQQLEKLPKEKVVNLVVSPRAYVDRVSVVAIQGNKEILLFEGKLPKEVNEVTFTVKPESSGLKEGEARVVVKLRRFYIFEKSFEVRAIVDTQPPRIHILYAPYTVLQGGSGGIKVKLSEPAQLYVEVGGRKFKSYKVKEDLYISLFGVPVDTSPRDVIKVVAIDEVGNETVIPLGTGIKRNNFQSLRIELSGKEKVMLPKLGTILGGNYEGSNFVELFKKVNEEVRAENERKIAEVGGNSAPQRYWRGNFIQLKNSKVISRYGEKRTYTYRGKPISSSRHMGYDLASVKNSRVPAANHGVVVFAGDLGIYGNTVIIDHGYGLMSLYAHLADFRVSKGDMVKKGQVIGYTDMTGLAFGDHLHFGILIDGYEVTPLEWWDSKWIRTRIEPVFSY
ncbi:murein DD-endopeptidase MepM/ murein hydrolase activator NlpD [Hydrogenivirga caldilitoris]|uniref:Murein DD-endopeptidase MepM/ murein hydrolase activator NlpD n=1 Tax=Hydrogenivirga caldilitoris TaxID=246264 RepID=A0A497XT96_9AQUI|nr:M23 family metallopeptidase [Hydrogenivirga caldilitoris]RLJ70143.1 murein DD-endopeptidase MepM/ murein hydrolase activator NlpD [Hydrogenivirga caldilitoris]